MAPARTIAIVGAGFSGALLSIHLLARPSLRVTLIERRDRFARGLAYSTQSERHLLNVRTGRMSAFPDRPDDLVQWLSARALPADPAGFTARKLYGEYLEARLAEAEAGASGRLTRIAGEAARVDTLHDGPAVALTGGEHVRADAVVLALGNAPPADLAQFEALGSDRYISDPWAPGALAAIDADDPVLLIGTGLTMIDVLLSLAEQGWAGQALALSRRGLLPRSHPEAPPQDAAPWRPQAGPLSQQLRSFRRHVRASRWDRAMDALRPFNQALWQEAPEPVRRRFLRHLRPWWDVHRHRTAPEVGASIQALIHAGRLQVAAGRVERATATADRVQVRWRRRGDGAAPHLWPAAFVVNCTGPLSDLRSSREPLLRDLLARGLARPDRYRLGLEVDETCRVVDAQGRAARPIYALGPPTRGLLWEINAVPELRVQAAELAARLAGAG